MAKLSHVKAARKDIYSEGKRIDKPSNKKGYTIDRSQPADDKDTLLIKKGESYYHWQFMYGRMQVSKERPRRSQLTQSEFMGWLFDMEDVTLPNISLNVTIDMDADSAQSDLEQQFDDVISAIDEQREELEGRLDNMPEGLKEGNSGQILQERIDALQEWSDSLTGVKDGISFDEFSFDEESEQTRDEQLEEYATELQSQVDAVIEEFQGEAYPA